MSDVKIQPTVGRVVWYWPADHEMVNVIDETQPFAASVVYVQDADMVNLVVYDHSGRPQSRLGVRHLDPDGPRKGVWSWMPYQIGQARKEQQKEQQS